MSTVKKNFVFRCATCGNHTRKVCGGCRTTRYCDKQCQVKDRVNHKQVCDPKAKDAYDKLIGNKEVMEMINLVKKKASNNHFYVIWYVCPGFKVSYIPKHIFLKDGGYRLFILNDNDKEFQLFKNSNVGFLMLVFHQDVFKLSYHADDVNNYVWHPFNKQRIDNMLMVMRRSSVCTLPQFMEVEEFLPLYVEKIKKASKADPAI